MLTGSQQQVDSSNRSSQRDLSQQFSIDVLARQMVSLAQIGCVSLWNTCHNFKPSLRSVCLDPATKLIISHVFCTS